MIIDPQFISDFWLLFGALVYAWILYHALRTAAWWRLRNATDLNILLYAILGVWLIWQLNTDFENSHQIVGPVLHLLGATLLAMMFGWSFAIIGISLVVALFTFLHIPAMPDALKALPWNALATGILPVTASYWLYRRVDRHLPNNFFIYIFICAFFGAALAMASVVLVTAALHHLTGAYTFEKLTQGYIPFGLLLMFPEAFLTGMLMSIFVVYQPHWVTTFDDRRYLRKPD